jgi:hypothetical protein
MTTDYVSVPSTWTAGEALSHIAKVGRRKPVYAIYVLDLDDHRLVHVVSLRELVVADRTTRVMDIGEHQLVGEHDDSPPPSAGRKLTALDRAACGELGTAYQASDLSDRKCPWLLLDRVAHVAP